MKKKFILLISVLIFIISMLFVLGSQEDSKIYEDEGYLYSRYAYISLDDWKSLDISSSRFESAEELLLSVDDYVGDISKVLDRENWMEELKQMNGDEFDPRIRIKFTFGISEAYGAGAGKDSTNISPRILLNRSLFEIGASPIAHEIAHVISPHSQSQSFSEGLACYIQDTIGLNDTPPNNGKSLDEISLEYIDTEYHYIIDFVGIKSEKVNRMWSRISKERVLLYSFSGSFSDYIISEYGMKKYMLLYCSDFSDEMYIEIIGHNRLILIEDWQEHLNLLIIN